MSLVVPRQETLARLRRSVAEGRPVLAAGCSAGIIAKCADLAGADLIVMYSTGLSRLRGSRTTLIDDSNAVTLRMLKEIRPVVQNAPIIVGIEATEPPPERDLRMLLESFVQEGCSGVINFPTVAIYRDPEKRRQLETTGRPFSREVEMVRRARRMDLFTMAYVFDAQEAALMAHGGVDCIVAHVGGTAGGLEGFDAVSLDEAAAKAQSIIAAAKAVQPEVLCLAHGGPLATPEDTRYLYRHTDAVGFVGASSIERIPIEQAVMGAVRAFKSIPLRTGA